MSNAKRLLIHSIICYLMPLCLLSCDNSQKAPADESFLTVDSQNAKTWTLCEVKIQDPKPLLNILEQYENKKVVRGVIVQESYPVKVRFFIEKNALRELKKLEFDVVEIGDETVNKHR